MSDISLPFQPNWGHFYAWYGLIDNLMCTSRSRFLFIAQVWTASAHVWDAHFLSTEADPNTHPSPEQNSKHCLLRLFIIYRYIYLLSASICRYNNRPDYPGANKDWPRLSRRQVRIGFDCPGARYDWLRLSRSQVRIGLDYPGAT